MNKWDNRYMALAEHVAGWSKDPSTRVGAVIVDELGRVVGTGYNGFPRGVKDDDDRYEDRDVKYKMVVHAEVNAVLNSVANPRGCMLYSTFHPCSQCAALLIQAGIAAVCTKHNSSDERWTEDRNIANIMFTEAGVTLITLDEPDSIEDEDIPF